MHTAFSQDCDTPPDVLVRRCHEVGLNCIAVTDHNVIEGALEARRLAAPYSDLMVIVGEEVKSSQGDIIGLFLKEEVPRGLSPMDTVRCIKDQGGLVMVPHPFDAVRRGPLSPDALRQVLPHVDVIEILNARTILSRDLEKCRSLAAETPIPTVGVSDAHTPGELGSAYVEFDKFDGSPSSFKYAVGGGRIVGHRSTPLVHLVTGYVKVKKRFFPGRNSYSSRTQR
ncbi:MAG: PHP domain-containing protein [Dehalococcoidia bacterium]|nr:PHP domain-containing protein [Dehalococcoidia bacterium]